MSSTADLITRSKQLRVNFSCAFPTTSKVSANGYDIKDIIPDVLKEEQGFGEFAVLINLYQDEKFTQRLDNGEAPVEVSVQDRIFFEVKLDSIDQRLTVFAENCSVTPTANKDDPRRYYLLKKGCKTDPTLRSYASPPNAHRMSYESFTFVGVEDPVTYLQCDVSICDNQAKDRRCRDRKCAADDSDRKRRSLSHGYTVEKEHPHSGFVIHSKAIITHELRRHSRKTRSVRLQTDLAANENKGFYESNLGKILKILLIL